MRRFAHALSVGVLVASASASVFSVDGAGGAIPDPVATPGVWNQSFTGSALTSSVQVASPVASLSAVRLHAFRHTWRGDVHAYLQDPAGAKHNLIVRPGSDGANSGDHGDFVLGEFALVASGGASLQQGGANLVSGDYAPYMNVNSGRWTNGIGDEPLSAIHAPAGTWTLVIEDWGSLGTGALGGWTLEGLALDVDQPFCAGDGLDALVTTPCPCAHFGTAGRGCANSVNPVGAQLLGLGHTSDDSAALFAQGMPVSTSTLFLQGDERVDERFGDGVRCVGGNLVRLGVRVNVAGTATLPGAGEPALSVRGGVAPGGGATRFYQACYRNSAVAYCPPELFNATNGWVLVW